MLHRLPTPAEPTATPEPSPAGDEAALIRAAQADPTAFAALYERYLPRVYRYARARSAGVDDAEDLTQAVFLRALAALPAYRPRGVPFAAWLFRIARNAVTDSHRRRRDSVTWDGLPEAFQRSEEGDPAAFALRSEQIDALHKLLRNLPPETRELLALRFAAGLSSVEIAHTTGRSEAAVKKQLSRTIQRLQEQFRA